MITYDILWKTLKEMGKKKTDLLEIMSPSTLSKLNKNGTITTDTIDKICKFLDCKPTDIINYQTDKDRIDKIVDNMDAETKKGVFEKLKKSFMAGMDYMTEMPDDEFEEFKNKSFNDKKRETIKEMKKRTWEIANDEEIEKDK